MRRRGLVLVGGGLAVLGGAGLALAQGTAAPTAVTGGANAIHIDSARVEGSVNPNGLATSYRFEYGPTAAYGSTTPARPAGAGTAPEPVSATLTPLRPGQDYHYRLVAESSAGTALGGDRTFTTLDPRLQGKFGVRLKITQGGDPFHQRRGQHVHRAYRFKPHCAAALCPRVRLVREAQRGRFRSQLKRVGPGVYRGEERFGKGRCDNGLGFESRTAIAVRVARTVEDHASRIRGNLDTGVRGCVSGSERATLTGKRRGRR